MSNFLTRFFAKPAPALAEPILHKDFRIFPEPIREAAAFRIAARIEKTFGAEIRTHQLIRADTRTSRDEAVQASADKARQAIDQLGDTLFGG